MKKILLGLIVVALIFGLTACSQDQYQALGDAMGNMSGNIYGITANLKDVENATNKVDGAVAVDGDGKVTVKLEAETAASIVNSVVAVKNSDTKKEALKTSLSEPLLGKGATDASKAELKAQITAQATEKTIDTTGLSAKQAELATLVNAVLEDVGASLSENPTKAELATVAVLATLADAVKAGDEAAYREAGKAAVDALKITSEIGQVDIFANVNISSLFNMVNEKAIARDGEEVEEEVDLFAPLFESSVSEVMACITENGEFTEQRYNKFVMECKAMRASYEMIAKGYDIDVAAPLKGQAAVDTGLVIEDLGHYIISVVFSAADSYAEDTIDFLSTFINGEGEEKGYYDILISGDLDKLPDFSDESFDMDDDFTEAIIANMGGDLEGEDFSEMIMELVRDENTVVGGRVSNVLKTIGVILIDSEYESLLSQIEVEGENAPAAGSLQRFLYAF
ncbi:MAG: hypothetical protein ILP16_02255 [Spirochaetales bacterium]|nr:hypothetical protein [Spirochaetales bacterium]